MMRPSMGGIRRARSTAKSRMKDACVVEFTDGSRDGDDNLIYSARFASKCLIKSMGFADSDREVGGRRETTGVTEIHMPWNVPAVHQDDRIRITAISRQTPSRMLGKTWIVGTDHDVSDNTATRIVVKEEP